MKSNRSALVLLSLSCILGLAACGSSTPVLRYITISPPNQTILSGTTQQFTATGYYSNGSITPGIAVSWSSSNTAVASINGTTGVATGLTGGTTTITATALGITSGTTTLTVNAVTSISVIPQNPTIAVGQTQQFTATANTGNVTSAVTWSSGTPSVATISSGGLATAVANGTSLITATLGSVSGNTTLTVGVVPVSLVISPASPTIAVGNEEPFTAQEKWSDGTLHTPAGPVSWTSATTSTANILATTGQALGLAAGTSAITATEGTLTGNTTLTVVAASTHFAYVSNDGASTIQWYTVSTTASPYLTSEGTYPSSGTGATQTVIHPSGQYLYYTDNNTNIWVTTIDSSTGALTATAFPSQVAGSGHTNFTVIDPYGRFLYVSDDAGQTIYGFQINQTNGSLTLISGSPFTANLDSPECLIIDHTGSYLYATNPLNNTISAYTIGQTTGALTPLSTPTFPSGTGTGPLLGALDPSGTHLYVANTLSNSIAGFSIGTGGVLTSLGTDTAVTGAIAVENLVVDPAGTHIYVLDEGPNASGTGQVFGFVIGSGGVIGAAISGTPIATGTTPLGAIVIDPADTLLAVDNNGSNNISDFIIGAGGVLTAATPPTVSTGTAPLYVTFYNAP